MGGKIWVIHAKYGSYESIFASFSSCWNNLILIGSKKRLRNDLSISFENVLGTTIQSCCISSKSGETFVDGKLREAFISPGN